MRPSIKKIFRLYEAPLGAGGHYIPHKGSKYPQDIKSYEAEVDRELQKFYGYGVKPPRSNAPGVPWKDKIDKYFGFPGAADKFVRESFKNFRTVEECISDMEAMWEMADQGGAPDPSYRYLFIDKSKPTFNSPAVDMVPNPDWDADDHEDNFVQRTRLPKNDADFDPKNFDAWHIRKGGAAHKNALDDFEEL